MSSKRFVRTKSGKVVPISESKGTRSYGNIVDNIRAKRAARATTTPMTGGLRTSTAKLASSLGIAAAAIKEGTRNWHSLSAQAKAKAIDMYPHREKE